jgi:hypothetical protein
MGNFRLRVKELVSNTELPSVHARTTSTTVTATTTTTTTANTTALEPNFGPWTPEILFSRFSRLVPTPVRCDSQQFFCYPCSPLLPTCPLASIFFRIPYSFPSKIFLDILDLSILQTCPAPSNFVSSVCSYIYVVT